MLVIFGLSVSFNVICFSLFQSYYRHSKLNNDYLNSSIFFYCNKTVEESNQTVMSIFQDIYQMNSSCVYVVLERRINGLPVVFVLNTSNSMREEGFAQIKKAFLCIISFSKEHKTEHMFTLSCI